MNETLQLWLFGGAYGLGVAAIVFAFGLHNKLIRIEAFIEMFGKKSAKMLHSPDDHLHLDYYLDKYISNTYDMSQDEWLELKNKCEELEHNMIATLNERGLAGFIAAVCMHKLMRFDPSKYKEV